MGNNNLRPTTIARHDKIFQTYREVILEEIEEAKKSNKPDRVKNVSKSYLYGIVADRTGYESTVVGRLIQRKLREKGVPRARLRKVSMVDIMDEEIKFILSV